VGAGVVAIVTLGGGPGPLDEHRGTTAATAREADQEVLRGEAPGRSLTAGLELLLDRFEKIFPHKWFMGSRSILTAPDDPTQVRTIRQNGTGGYRASIGIAHPYSGNLSPKI
jgi:hypothetical protein